MNRSAEKRQSWHSNAAGSEDHKLQQIEAGTSYFIGVDLIGWVLIRLTVILVVLNVVVQLWHWWRGS